MPFEFTTTRGIEYVPRVNGFFHAGITVQDMDTSLRFYRDGLGLETYFDRFLDGS